MGQIKISFFRYVQDKNYHVWFSSAMNRQLAPPGATIEVSFKKSIKHERIECFTVKPALVEEEKKKKVR